MTYATVMVHLELGEPNAGLLRIAGDLAARCGAKLVGIAACQPLELPLGDGFVTAEVIEQNLADIDAEIRAAEAEFRCALEPRKLDLEWRSAVTFGALYDYLAGQARSADLVVTTVDRRASLFDSSHHVAIGDLVMRAGRPILIVPKAQETLGLDHVLVGWKDTREARRATSDALPLLKLAGRVTVVEIAPPEQTASTLAHLDDVVAWLGRHGVAATALASPATGDDAARLDAIVRAEGADLVVAGAYGHSRVLEWVFGGVTRDLLLSADRCALVSH